MQIFLPKKTLYSKFCSSFYPILKAKLKRYVFHSMQDKMLMIWSVVLIYVKKIGAFGEIVYAFLWPIERFVLLLHRRNTQVRYAMRLHFDMTQ